MPKRKLNKNSKPFTASDRPLILQTFNPVIKRNLQAYFVATSDATGTINSYTDIAALLTASSDWTNMSGSYLACKVTRVHMEFIPFVKYYTSGSTAYYGNVSLGYSASTYANPGSSYNVLNNACSQWLLCDSRHMMSFVPQIKSGARGPLDITLWTGLGIAGSIVYYAQNAWPASATCFCVRVVFECEFTNPG